MMQKSPRLRWGYVVMVCAAAIGTMGQSCALSPPPVHIELINTTGDPVDPGFFVDGALMPVDPPLDPSEVITRDFPCSPDTTLQSDATLITPSGNFASDNFPLIATDRFQCGDVVSFVFIDDGTVFFIRVEVNGVFLTDTN